MHRITLKVVLQITPKVSRYEETWIYFSLCRISIVFIPFLGFVQGNFLLIFCGKSALYIHLLTGNFRELGIFFFSFFSFYIFPLSFSFLAFQLLLWWESTYGNEEVQPIKPSQLATPFFILFSPSAATARNFIFLFSSLSSGKRW